MTVNISRSVLNGFRRRALSAYPKEYIETIWGKRNASGIHIAAFRELEHEATNGSVDYDPEELKIGEREAGLVCLGTIHSHPFGELKQADAAPSEHDWDSYKRDGELISGLYGIWKRNGKRRGRVRFFFSQSILDVKYTQGCPTKTRKQSAVTHESG